MQDIDLAFFEPKLIIDYLSSHLSSNFSVYNLDLDRPKNKSFVSFIKNLGSRWKDEKTELLLSYPVSYTSFQMLDYYCGKIVVEQKIAGLDDDEPTLVESLELIMDYRLFKKEIKKDMLCKLCLSIASVPYTETKIQRSDYIKNKGVWKLTESLKDVKTEWFLKPVYSHHDIKRG